MYARGTWERIYSVAIEHINAMMEMRLMGQSEMGFSFTPSTPE